VATAPDDPFRLRPIRHWPGRSLSLSLGGATGLRVSPGVSFMGVYGLAHAAKSLVWQVSETLFAFFLTEAVGLPPATMGWILAASLAVNAVGDLAVGGYLARRVRSVADAGRAQKAGALAAGAAFALFSLAALMPGAARTPFVLVTILLFRLAYPLVDNPQNAMLALATDDDGGRVRLAVVRYTTAGLSSLAIALAVMPLVDDRHAGARALGFAALAGLLALGLAASALALERRARSPEGLPIRGRTSHAARREQGSAPISAPIVFGSIFAFAICNAVFGKLLPYFTAFASASVLSGGILMACMAIGRFLSQFLWSGLARRHSVICTLRIAALCWAAGALAFSQHRVGGLPLLGAAGLLYGAGCSGVLMALWALAASAVRCEAAPRPATLVFGRLTFCSKLGSAGSFLVIAWLLAGTPYRDAASFAGGIAPFMVAAPVLGAIACLMLSFAPGRARRRVVRPPRWMPGARRTGA
jgi:GPH family glycoside/pentoside/hexuronide:cation symporter